QEYPFLYQRQTCQQVQPNFFFQAEDGIRDLTVTGVQTCALPISAPRDPSSRVRRLHEPRERRARHRTGERRRKDRRDGRSRRRAIGSAPRRATKSSNLSETAEVPACNVPSRSPLPALAIAPETKL